MTFWIHEHFQPSFAAMLVILIVLASGAILLPRAPTSLKSKSKKEASMARSYLPSFLGRDDDPFGSLFREVQKTFEDFSRRSPLAALGSEMLAPKVDVAESKDAIDLTVELPGVDEKDVDVTLADGMLTIRGEKKSERDEKNQNKNWHVVERSYGSFNRTISLPFDPDPANVEAKVDKGVLHIHLPKPAEVAKKQQKIEIKKA
jgi:HSP20 family protein